MPDADVDESADDWVPDGCAGRLTTASGAATRRWMTPVALSAAGSGAPSPLGRRPTGEANGIEAVFPVELFPTELPPMPLLPASLTDAPNGPCVPAGEAGSRTRI